MTISLGCVLANGQTHRRGSGGYMKKNQGLGILLSSSGNLLRLCFKDTDSLLLAIVQTSCQASNNKIFKQEMCGIDPRFVFSS